MTKAIMKEKVKNWNIKIGKEVELVNTSLDEAKNVAESVGVPRWCSFEKIIEDVASTGNLIALKKVIDIYADVQYRKGMFDALIEFQKDTDNFNL